MEKKLLLKVLPFLLFFLLCYTRFVNLGWGLPYTMHPDERNMAVALQSLSCTELSLEKCLNPNFFAYGQFPLYLGYFLVILRKLWFSDNTQINILEATVVLRFISGIASVLNAFVIVKVVKIINKRNNSNIKSQTSKSQFNIQNVFLILLIMFSPFFIQFSHFGTTESLLMFFYSFIIYLSLRFLSDKNHDCKLIILSSLISGLALATKISSFIFLSVPSTTILSFMNIKKIKKTLAVFLKLFVYIFTSLFFAVIFSPHNLISFPGFLVSMRYESGVALGKYLVFYTKQFVDSVPILFQTYKVFPYALGLPIFILFILGFLFLSWKDKKINLLRFAFLAYFVPTAFMFAKWTRFMAPVMPVMLIFSTLILISIIELIYKGRILKFLISNFQFSFNLQFSNLIKKIIFTFFLLFIITPGLAYLSIYENKDVRFTASEWIYKNIPSNSNILSETANVVELPLFIPDSKYNINLNSFYFYDLDRNIEAQKQLYEAIKKTDYIFVPSRRVFANQTCHKIYNNQFSLLRPQIWRTTEGQAIFNNGYLKDRCKNLKENYPLLNEYYNKLFSGKLGFVKIAEVSSYPKIVIFDKTFLEFPDEQSEETWTVFDHPVIRIFKRIEKKSEN